MQYMKAHDRLCAMICENDFKVISDPMSISDSVYNFDLKKRRRSFLLKLGRNIF